MILRAALARSRLASRCFGVRVAVNELATPSRTERRDYFEDHLRRGFKQDAGLFNLNLTKTEPIKAASLGTGKPLVKLIAGPARHAALNSMA